MSGSKSRNKGAGGERELAKVLSRLFGVEAHRGRQYHGGSDSPDVKTKINGVHWECKRAEVFSVYKALEQATKDAPLGDVGVVAHRRNRAPWVFCCYLEDLPEVIYLVSRLATEDSELGSVK